jgi:hypothetical protein
MAAAGDDPLVSCKNTWDTLLERECGTAAVLSVGNVMLNRPMRPLSNPGVNGCSEALLWNVAVHSETWLEARKNSPSEFIRTSTTWDTLIGHGVISVALFRAGQGVAALNEACAAVSEVMSQGHSNLLPIMLVEFCCKWVHFPDVRRSLLRYFTKLAAMRLGIQHPLTVVLFHLLDENVAVLCMTPALQIATKSAERETLYVDDISLRLRHAYCCMLIDCEQYQAALAPQTWLYNEARRVYGQSGELTRCALLRRGEIEIGLENPENASVIYKEVLELSEGDYYNQHSLDAVGIEAARGDVEGVRHVCKKALEDFWTPFSQRSLKGMGRTLKIMLDEMLVAAETRLGVRKSDNREATASDDPSDDSDFQVWLQEVLTTRNLNDYVDRKASMKHSALCGISQGARFDPKTASLERDEMHDPFVAKHHQIVRQSTIGGGSRMIRPFPGA